MTFVVVGSGLSGLAAAYRLQQTGVQVTVLERGNDPGGRAQTEQHGDYLVDTGADALTGSYQTYLGLLGELGLSGRLVNCSRVIGIVRGGRIIDIDPRAPSDPGGRATAPDHSQEQHIQEQTTAATTGAEQ